MQSRPPRGPRGLDPERAISPERKAGRRGALEAWTPSVPSAVECKAGRRGALGIPVLLLNVSREMTYEEMKGEFNHILDQQRQNLT